MQCVNVKALDASVCVTSNECESFPVACKHVFTRVWTHKDVCRDHMNSLMTNK